MAPEAQRIAIAEACGYTNVRKDRHGYLIGDGKPDHFGIPHYRNDLNAIHEAEKSRLTTMGERGDYVIQLGAVVDKAGWKDHNFMITHATASQRSEAFLKTLGLWKDDASNLNTVAIDTATN